jgi:hypothetical protein
LRLEQESEIQICGVVIRAGSDCGAQQIFRVGQFASLLATRRKQNKGIHILRIPRDSLRQQLAGFVSGIQRSQLTAVAFLHRGVGCHEFPADDGEIGSRMQCLTKLPDGRPVVFPGIGCFTDDLMSGSYGRWNREERPSDYFRLIPFFGINK